jgi:hypothetical protein
MHIHSASMCIYKKKKGRQSTLQGTVWIILCTLLPLHCLFSLQTSRLGITSGRGPWSHNSFLVNGSSNMHCTALCWGVGVSLVVILQGIQQMKCVWRNNKMMCTCSSPGSSSTSPAKDKRVTSNQIWRRNHTAAWNNENEREAIQIWKVKINHGTKSECTTTWQNMEHAYK